MVPRTTGFICQISVTAAVSMSLAGCNSEPTGYRKIEQSHVEQPQQAESAVGHAMVTEADRPANVSLGEVQIDASPVDDLPVSALAPVNVIQDVAALLKASPADRLPRENTTDPIVPTSATASSTTLRKPELLIPEKTFVKDAKSRASRVSYDDLDLLKVLNLDPVTEDAVDLMPGWLTSLNGQRIRVRGYMFPTFESEGIERFVLARDNQICCFGRDPKIYDLIEVTLHNGKTTNYIPATRAFDVVGTFKIAMEAIDGKPFGLYYIDDAEIIDR